MRMKSAISREQIESGLSEPEEITNMICGRVIKLEADGDVDKRTTGTVTISYLDEVGRGRKFRLMLKNEDYGTAIRAHKQGSYVKVTNVAKNNSSRQIARKYGEFCIIE